MKLTRPLLILFLGVQGSGKGTQADLLAEKLDLKHLVAGDMFRAVATENTPLGRSVKANLEQGRIMTIDQWDQVVGRFLEKNNITQGAVLDAFLRSLEQIDHFEAIATERKLPEIWVVYLDLPEGEALKRLLKRGRADDTPDQIRERFAWSKNQALPVVDYFRKLGRVVEIDGNHTIEEVQQTIVAKLTKRGLLI